MAKEDQDALDGTGIQGYVRKENVKFETKDLALVMNLMKDVAVGKKRFFQLQRDEQTGELVEFNSGRRIMPKITGPKKAL